jgi:hypothetical protein
LLYAAEPEIPPPPPVTVARTVRVWRRLDMGSPT